MPWYEPGDTIPEVVNIVAFEWINNESTATNNPYNNSTPIMKVMKKKLYE